MNAIMSIKPKYVEEIVNGRKKFEYRKNVFKKSVEKVYIYSSSPEKKIVGYFIYSGYVENSPINIWNLTNQFSGISKDDYFKYFKGRDLAYAYHIKEITIFDESIDPKDVFYEFRAPQSYMYIDGEI